MSSGMVDEKIIVNIIIMTLTNAKPQTNHYPFRRNLLYGNILLTTIKKAF